MQAGAASPALQPAEGWQVMGASIRGASHIRSGLENQDAWGVWRANDPQRAIAAVVCDGHGSPRCIRSARGAALGVEAVRTVLGTVSGAAGGELPSAAALADGLAAQVVDTWRSLVSHDLLAHPIRPDEFDRLTAARREQALVEVMLNPALAYGATLLMCLVTDEHVLCAQLGDGDILLVCDDGRCRRALAADPNLLANQTTSLCSEEAARQVRVALLPRSARLHLVLLSTDGVSNAFRSDADFFRLGEDLLQDLAARPAAELADDLPGWLEEFSQMGSGDDATICLMAPRAVMQLAEPIAMQPAETETLAAECDRNPGAPQGAGADDEASVGQPPTEVGAPLGLGVWLCRMIRRVPGALQRTRRSVLRSGDGSAQGDAR